VLHAYGGGTLQVASVRHLQPEQTSSLRSWKEQSNTDNAKSRLSLRHSTCHIPRRSTIQNQMACVLGSFEKC
jgi:hypothetical protein